MCVCVGECVCMCVYVGVWVGVSPTVSSSECCRLSLYVWRQFLHLVGLEGGLTASPPDDGASRGWSLIAHPGDSTAFARPSPLRRGPWHA